MPKHEASGVVRAVSALNEWLATSAPPGPAIFPTYWIINFQKGGSLFFCLWLMHRYQNYSAPALMYTVAHGSYGMLWLLKHVTFPDPKWNVKQTFMSVIVAISLVLAFGAASAVLGPIFCRVQLPSRDLALWPRWHFESRWQEMRDAHFAAARAQRHPQKSTNHAVRRVRQASARPDGRFPQYQTDSYGSGALGGDLNSIGASAAPRAPPA